jgi:hypothetical protein
VKQAKGCEISNELFPKGVKLVVLGVKLANWWGEIFGKPSKTGLDAGLIIGCGAKR